MTKPSKPKFVNYVIIDAAASVDSLTLVDSPNAYFPSAAVREEENVEDFETLPETLVLRTKDSERYSAIVLTPKKVEELVTVLQYWLVTHGGD